MENYIKCYKGISVYFLCECQEGCGSSDGVKIISLNLGWVRSIDIWDVKQDLHRNWLIISNYLYFCTREIRSPHPIKNIFHYAFLSTPRMFTHVFLLFLKHHNSIKAYVWNIIIIFVLLKYGLTPPILEFRYLIPYLSFECDLTRWSFILVHSWQPLKVMENTTQLSTLGLLAW